MNAVMMLDKHRYIHFPFILFSHLFINKSFSYIVCLLSKCLKLQFEPIKQFGIINDIMKKDTFSSAFNDAYDHLNFGGELTYKYGWGKKSKLG